jgi:hypothetical protein|tara:strand:+ start:928 stop:1155 length:228 start_codon:yes stop_codon:yes gene_type:complete
MHLIVKETHYDNIENSYDIADFHTNDNIATEKLQGYILINQDKDVTYSIVKYDSPFTFKVNNTDNKFREVSALGD